MVWWRRVDDETEAGGGPDQAEAPPARLASETDRAHQLSGTFSGDSYWGAAPQAPAAAAEAAPEVDHNPPKDTLSAPEPATTTPAEAAPADPAATLANPSERHDAPMADYQSSLNEAMQIDGALGVALVDSQSGMALATAGNPDGIDLNVAAAGNSNVVQAKLRTMRDLGLNQRLEDILITLETQYHIIRTFNREDGIFLYLVLDKSRANLAMARFKLAGIEKQLVI